MIPLRAVGRAPLHTLLWIAQAALVIAFELTGVLKSCVPTLQLQGELHLLAGVPEAILPVVGALEAAGAVLLLLPSTLRILPALAPLAAAALGGVALLGATVPATGAALAMPLPNLILAALAAFVAWGRWLPARIEPFRFEQPARLLEREQVNPAPSLPRWPPQRPIGPWANA